METKYYVNSSGDYLGGFCGSEPPQGAIQVPMPPNNGLDKWVNEAWVAYIPIPQIVTRRQARRALLQADLLDHIQPAIDAIIDAGLRAQAQIDWDDATEFKRDDATLILLAQALELSDEQLDQLFIHAAQY